MVKTKKIKALDGFSQAADTAVVSRGIAIQTGLTGNPNFPNSPVDLSVMKTNIESLSPLVSESLDGSKKVIAQKNKQRETVIESLRLLARYVEVACKNDMAIFQTSGFQAASTTKNATAPLSEKIRKIEHSANSGQVIVRINTVRGASSYELRYGPMVNGAPPATWTNIGVAKVKAPVVVTGLTPTTTYAFQARALGKDGYTDWSDTLTFICT